MGDNIMFQLQLTMFLMLAVGFICAKRGLLNEKGRESITNVFISIMIPCSIVSSFYSSLTPKLLVRGAWMVAAYTGTLTFCWLAGKILYRPFETSKKQVLNYATMISNAQFMGFPIVEAVLGEEGLVLAALAMIPGNIFTWTIALAQFTKINGKDGIKKYSDASLFSVCSDWRVSRRSQNPASGQSYGWHTEIWRLCYAGFHADYRSDSVTGETWRYF